MPNRGGFHVNSFALIAGEGSCACGSPACTAAAIFGYSGFVARSCFTGLSTCFVCLRRVNFLSVYYAKASSLTFIELSSCTHWLSRRINWTPKSKNWGVNDSESWGGRPPTLRFSAYPRLSSIRIAISDPLGHDLPPQHFPRYMLFSCILMCFCILWEGTLFFSLLLWICHRLAQTVFVSWHSS